MRHMPEDVWDPRVPPAARNLTEYLRAIVREAISMKPGMEETVIVHCRRRPKRQPCKALLSVRVQEVPAQIHWHCPACGDTGIITHWQEVNLHSTPPIADHNARVTISDEAYRELRKAIIVGPGESIIRKAIGTRDGVVLKGGPKDWDDLLGWLAGEINHEPRRARMLLLNEVYEEIEGMLADHGHS